MAEMDEADETRPPHASEAEQNHPRARWRKRTEPQAAGSGSGQAGAATEVDERAGAGELLLKELLAAEQAKSDDAALRLQRTQADFANYKRRSEQEREQQAKFATQLLVQEMLPVIDNLDRALSTIPDDVRALPWTDGLLLVDRQLRSTLEKQGLNPIEAVGARFDPKLHEAIIHEESTEHADDEVITELRRGYMFHDRVVRPTLVKVAKHVEQTQSQEEK